MAILTGHAWAQANLRPDPSARVPPQPGQGLPIEDAQFLATAQRINKLVGSMARLATERGGQDVKALAAKLDTEHQRLDGELQKIISARGVSGSSGEINPREGGPGGAAGALTSPKNAAAVGRGEQVLKELSGLDGEAFDRRWVQEQLGIHERLVDLYQTEASHSPDTELAKFAITTLNHIQVHRGVLRDLGRRYGLKVERTGQPPQY
ncbi:MAG TPA: DUF4142 domain-containing protein [Azospirillum sp.]|nr:DUF4142 domain-containing protein [Azospirillum sp.]